MDEATARQSYRSLRLVIATILISAFLGSLLSTLFLLGPEMVNGASAEAFWNMVPSLFLLALLVSPPFVALGLILFGLPADYLLRTVGISHPLAYAACGVSVGLLLGAVVAWGDGQLFVNQYGPIGASYGVATSLVFWRTFRRERPAKGEA